MENEKIKNGTSVIIVTATMMLSSPCAGNTVTNNNDLFQSQQAKTEYVTSSEQKPNSKEKGKEFIKWFWDMFYSVDGDGNFDNNYLKEHNCKTTFSLNGTNTDDLAKGIIENLDGYVFGQKDSNNKGIKDNVIDVHEFDDFGIDEVKKREDRRLTSEEVDAYDKFLRYTFHAMDINEPVDKLNKFKNTIDKDELRANLDALSNNNTFDGKELIRQIFSAMDYNGHPTNDFEKKRKNFYNKQMSGKNS